MFGLCSVLNSFVTPKIQQSFSHLYFPVSLGAILCLISQVFLICLIKLDKQNEKNIGEKKKSPSPNNATNTMEFNQIWKFSGLFWCLAFYYGMTGATFFSFTNIANDYIHRRFGFTNVAAGNILCLIYFMNGIATPLFGLLVDKYGKRSYFIILACLFGIASTLLLILIPDCHECYIILIPLFLFGIFLSFSDAAALPSVPLVVK